MKSCRSRPWPNLPSLHNLPRLRRWSLCAAAGALLLAGSTIAPAQQSLPPVDAGYPAREFEQLVSGSASLPQESSDLEGRIADLEAELAKIKDQAAEEKKKAAGKPSVTVGGRIYLDWALFDQGAASLANYGDWQDGVEVRSGRICLDGEAFRVIDYRIEVDFAGTDVADQGIVADADGTGFGPAGVDELIQSTAFRDLWITVNELPAIGHARVGFFKEPFGLEQLTRRNHVSFLERSVTDTGAFVPGRRLGLMAFNDCANERFTWAIGAFRNELENGPAPPLDYNDDGGTALTMRYTLLPWYDEASGGRGLLHLGACYSFRGVEGGSYRFRARPESHVAPYVVDTGNITDVPDVQLASAEAACVFGPFSVQSEVFHALVARDGFADPAFSGMYVFVSYFLTGESRPYDRREGVFARVKPFENFFLVRHGNGGLALGKGAWEVLYRYSYMDLNDAGITGGIVSDHTIGLNWWLNPYTRIMWNYVNSRSTPGDPAATPMTTQHIFEMRTQIDF